jgi:predicted transcriptional regulator
MNASTAKFIHLLGKDARLRIVEVLASTRTHKEVAELLGVTPAAVTKYLTRRTHPSDHVLARALEAVEGEELRLISEIIRDELLAGLRSYMAWALERGILTRDDIHRIEEIVYSGVLTLSARGRPLPGRA